MELTHFAQLPVSEKIKRSLTEMGLVEMFPIQAQAIPVLLEGKDLVGQAQTGTGKTAAFAIPILNKIDIDQKKTQALVLCPTRELAVQVSSEFQKMGRYLGVHTLAVYGGVSMDRQIETLHNGVQIVVGTPGRVLDHIRRGTIRLNEIKFLVLDEADRMLDMGFIDDVRLILEETPKSRQTMMFSATMPEVIQNLAKEQMREYHFISVSQDNITVTDIDQVWTDADYFTRIDIVKEILNKEDIESAMIFCNTKIGVDKLAQVLRSHGFKAEGISGDVSQGRRNKIITDFKGGQIRILVATDVVARGLDIKGVSHVINFNIPQEPQTYIHRIGRTGRAGKTGKAISLVTDRDKEAWNTIQWLVDKMIPKKEFLPPHLIKRREQRKPSQPKHWQWA